MSPRRRQMTRSDERTANLRLERAQARRERFDAARLIKVREREVERDIPLPQSLLRRVSL